MKWSDDKNLYFVSSTFYQAKLKLTAKVPSSLILLNIIPKFLVSA